MNRKNGIFSVILSIVIVLSNTSNSMEASEGINEEFQIKSGGAELYLKVQGQDISNPVLLYLHGGPGEANGPLLFQAYAGPELERHFVVGYLHQRNTCMSPEAPVESLTINQFIQDVDNVVTFLKEKFQQDKVFLLGHSFGGGLGFLYLLEHQDNIQKFVCAGGAFSTSSIEKNGYQTVIELSQKANNQEAVTKLKNIGPPPYETFQEGMVWRILYTNILEEMNEGMTKNLQISKIMSNTGIENFDPEWQRKSMVIVNTMWSELFTIDLEDKVQNIGIPMLLITGKKDILVPFRILKKGYENYGGQKEYVILERSNHFMFIDEPDLFVSKVIEFFR